MARKVIPLRFPLAGVGERLAFQSMPPYFTCESLNVWPDDAIAQRERGGSRPGLAKAFAALLGSGNPIRGMADVRFITGGALVTRLAAVANGLLYLENGIAAMVAATMGSLTLSTTAELSMVEFDQKLYINDRGPMLSDVTDGAIASGVTLTSATTGSFAALGINANDYVVVITDGGATTTDEVQTVTLSGTPTSGTFILSLALPFNAQDVFNVEGALTKTAVTNPIPFNATGATVKAAVELALAEIGVVVTVTAGGGALPGAAVTIAFDNGVLANLDVPLMTVNDAGLAGGTLPRASVAETTKGGAGIEGTYEITSVVTTTITLATSIGTTNSVTGVDFYVTRCPKIYNPVTDVLSRWVAATGKGQVPCGCECLVRYHSRLLLAGGLKSSNLVFACRIDDPLDWDYSVPNDPAVAWAAPASLAGTLAEPVTALVTHSDDCVIIGCVASTWVMRGDISYGGAIDRLSPNIGLVGIHGHCYTPEGFLWAMTNDGVYNFEKGCGAEPRSISREMLPSRLQNITSTDTVLMAYSLKHRGIFLYISPSTAAAPTHYFLDVKNTLNDDAGNSCAFWPMTVPGTMDPLSLYARNTRSPHCTVMHGSRDGYIRRFVSVDSDEIISDDGTTFESYFFYGPIKLGDTIWHRGMLYEIVAAVVTDNSVTCEVYVGDSAEEARNAVVGYVGKLLSAGNNPTLHARLSGNAAFIKLSAGSRGAQWAVESLAVVTQSITKLR